MLRDSLEHYFGVIATNCAETTFLNGNEAYRLGFDRDAAHLLAGFGGGAGCGNFCGALAGAIAVIGAVELPKGAIGGDAPLLRPRCKLMVERFREEFGSEMCRDIKPNFEACPGKCQEVQRRTADLLEAVLKAPVEPPAPVQK